jgi:hypothetical protein
VARSDDPWSPLGKIRLLKHGPKGEFCLTTDLFSGSIAAYAILSHT